MNGRSRAKWVAVAVLAVAVVAGLLMAGQAGAVSTPAVISSGRPDVPSISGALVAWADKRSGNWDVYTYDGATRGTTRITSDPADQAMPSLGDGLLAYVDFNANQGDIVLRNVSTGATSRLEILGPQMYPVVSGEWLAYEDHSGPYSTVVVHKLDGTYDTSFGGSNRSATRPMIAGDLVVFEDRDASTSAGDADIKVFDLVTKTTFLIASSPAQELFPATDGRYVAWAQGTGSGTFKIRLYDRQTDAYTDLSDGAGEQTRPFVAHGVVYWIDNSAGQPLHVDAYDIATGATSPYYTYSTGDVIALQASGHNTAWLENVGNRRRVRAVFSDGAGPLSGLTAFQPLAAAAAFRPLSVVAGTDAIAPTVTSTSVQPGQRNVSRTSPITVSFSEALSPDTVSSETFKVVSGETGDVVASSVTYSALTRSVTVTPVDRLADGTYALVVDPAVADAAGNRLGATTEVAFGTLGVAADVLPPTKPGILYARPSGLSNVEIAWEPAADDSGVIKEYRVYRNQVPLAAGDPLTGLVAVVDGSLTSVTTATASVDSPKAYTYYYCVVAVDPLDRLSDPSTNAAPNPHGTFGTSTRRGVRSCTRCHDVHGGMAGTPDLQANSAEQCYVCHGGTPGNDAYGVASTMDAQGNFNDDDGIATGGEQGVGNDGWSIHRTSYLYAGAGATVNYECMACHTAHRKSYDDDPTKSYGRLLRMYPSGLTGASRYSTDNAPFNETLCYQCHGAASLTLMEALSSGAYSNTGGDHQTEYAATGAGAVAHGAAVVMKNRPPRSRVNGGTLPNIACLACHNEHGSPNQGMTDYRQSNTTATTFNQAGLCLECHTSGVGADGQPEVISSGTAPFAWNGRDVKAEFQRTSKHPTSVGSGRWVAQSGTVFSQTLQADFGSDAMTQTVTTVLDSVVLDQYAQSTPIPSNPYVLVSQASVTGNTDSYLDGDAAWNEDFNPTSIGTNPGSGASSVAKNGVVFAFQGGASATMRTYTPPADSGTGTWGTTTNVWQNVGTGSDIASDTAHDYLWALVGNYTPVNADGGTNIRRTTAFAGTALAWYATTGYDGPAFRTGGIDRRLSGGAALVWMPAGTTRPERLYVVNRDSTNFATRDGQLWYYSNPDNATGGTNWTSTTQVLGRTDNGDDTGSRMVRFRIGSTDYIYFLRGQANVEYLLSVADDAAGTLTVLDNGTATPWNATPGDGCSVIWNGDTTQAGFRLYATRGDNAGTSFKVATWDGSALVWADGPALAANSTTGTYLSRVVCDPAGSVVQDLYYTSGTIMTGDITMPGRPTSWGTLTWTENEPANTAFGVTVQGWNGSTWSDLVTDATSPTDLSSYSVATYSKLRLVGTFTTTNQFATPRLDDWTVTSMVEVFEAKGSLTCANCHNAHEVKVGGASAWSLARVSDPSNIHNAAPADYGTFCTKCHQSASAPTFPSIAKRTTSEIVPYGVSFTVMPSSTYPFFAGWDKNATNADWAGSRHNAVAAIANDCGTCHDPHGSDFARLTALTQGANTRANTNASASSEQNLCYGASANNSCHYYASGTLQSWQVAGTGAPFNVATYKHPVATSGRHTDTETATQLGVGNRHAECVDCHDPHAARAGTHTQGQSAAGGALTGAFGVKPTYSTAVWAAPVSFSPERMDGGAGDYEAYLCFKCHSSYTTRPTTPSGGFAQTDLALEFNPANLSGHNVQGVDTNWPYINATRPAGWPTFPAFVSPSVAPWTSTSKMTCSDCHSYNAVGAKGPHGSANPYMLVQNNGTAHWWEATFSTWTTTGSPGFLCSKCHGNRTSNPAHNRGTDGHNIRCDGCHIRIPHGWKRPRLLRRIDGGTLTQNGFTSAADQLPYADPSTTTWTKGISYRDYAGSGVGRDDCEATCAGTHTGRVTTYWP